MRGKTLLIAVIIIRYSQLWYSSTLNFGENAQGMSTVRLFLCRSIGANNAHCRTGLPLLYITNSVAHRWAGWDRDT
jgi:hypothetical protein